jgi:hypothetical protein
MAGVAEAVSEESGGLVARRDYCFTAGRGRRRDRRRRLRRRRQVRVGMGRGGEPCRQRKGRTDRPHLGPRHSHRSRGHESAHLCRFRSPSPSSGPLWASPTSVNDTLTDRPSCPMVPPWPHQRSRSA